MEEEPGLVHLQKGFRLKSRVDGSVAEVRPRKLAWTNLIQETAWWIRIEQGYQQPQRT
jgi:hypothetical protein